MQSATSHGEQTQNPKEKEDEYNGREFESLLSSLLRVRLATTYAEKQVAWSLSVSGVINIGDKIKLVEMD